MNDAYFYRVEEKGNPDEALERPAVITNYPMIDEKLGQIAVEFWDLTWRSENRYLDYNMRLLLSLANAIGAGRKRQAMRELLKAYANGLDSRALDDVFEQFAWNMGIGYFSSEIAPSPLFQAYKTIKQMVKQGKGREEINKALKEKISDAGHGVLAECVGSPGRLCHGRVGRHDKDYIQKRPDHLKIQRFTLVPDEALIFCAK